MSLRLALLNTALRLFEKPFLARVKDPARLRKSFETKARFWFHPPKGSRFQPDQLAAHGNAVPAQWAKCGETRKDRVILYFHGGGYVYGSSRTHRAMLAKLSGLTGLAACLPDYRLAPENPFPAAFDDATTAYQALLDRGFAKRQIVIGGDSAGGGLALALLAEISRRHLPEPAGVFAFSPLTDLRFCSGSFSENADSEVVLPVTRATDMRKMYLQGQPPEDPRASPLFASYTGTVPVWLTVSDSEVLLDDTRAMAGNLSRQGVDVQCRIAHNRPHVWPIFQRLLPEADQTLADVADWIRLLAPWSDDS